MAGDAYKEQNDQITRAQAIKCQESILFTEITGYLPPLPSVIDRALKLPHDFPARRSIIRPAYRGSPPAREYGWPARVYV